MTMTRAEFEARLQRVATSWVGVPYLHNGRTRSQGIDCLGILVMALRECGCDVEDGDSQSYRQDWFQHEREDRYLAGLLARGDPVGRDQFLPGDILYFRTARFGRIDSDAVTHGGLWLGDGKFLHAISGRGVEIAEWRARAWQTTYAGAIRPHAVLRAISDGTS